MIKIKPILYILALLTIVLIFTGCAHSPGAGQIINSYFAFLQQHNYDDAASLCAKTFARTNTLQTVPISQYLQAVTSTQGNIENYKIVSKQKYTQSNTCLYEYEINVTRNGFAQTEKIQTAINDGSEQIISYDANAPSDIFVHNLYNQISNNKTIESCFSNYFFGLNGSPKTFVSNLESQFGALKSYQIESAKYYYKDYSGAAMQACAQFNISEKRDKFDADVVVTLAKGQSGILISDMQYTPTTIKIIMDSIMQSYKTDDYEILESLYSASYISTIGGEFNIHLNDIVLPLEKEYGDMVSYNVEDYSIFSMENENELSSPAISFNCTVEYEFGRTQEQITLAKDNGEMKIFIHYIFPQE